MKGISEKLSPKFRFFLKFNPNSAQIRPKFDPISGLCIGSYPKPALSLNTNPIGPFWAFCDWGRGVNPLPPGEKCSF